MKLVILLILLMPFVIAETYDEYQEITVNFKLNSAVHLSAGENGRLDSLKVALKLFPIEDSRQKILNFEILSDPKAEISSDEAYEFLWREFYNEYEYGIDADLNIRNYIAQIKSKIRFPIGREKFEPEIEKYLDSGEFIDFNDHILKRANKIIEGEDDYYRTVFKIGDWVQNNIKYDLNTITAKAVKKSSWTLDNREGVCDEITNLFISMLRMIGIPARFVTGVVYAGESMGWGNHGWAEVYFPDKGWVPWDVTLGQHGWIDPSHLKLSDSLDSGESSVEYSWRSYNVEVEPGGLDLITMIKNKGKKFPNLVKLNVKPLRDKIAFGSYLPIEIIVENLQDFYLSTTIIMTKGPEVRDNTQTILLAPDEIRSVFWLAKISEDLDEDFVYTSELEAKDSFGSKSRGKVFFAKNGEKLSEQEAIRIVESLMGRDDKELFVDIDVKCDYMDKEYRSNEKIAIGCYIMNKGTIFLENVKVCLDNDCKFLDAGRGERKNFSYSINAKEGIIFTVENEEFIKKINLNFNIVKIPEIYITDVVPNKVVYNTQTDVNFDVNSDFMAYNVVLDVNSLGVIKFGEIEGKKPVQFNINSKKLVSGLNIKISYEDGQGNKYSIEKTYPITVENVPWFVKYIGRIKDFFNSF